MRRSSCSARYRHTLAKGTPRPSAQARAASVRIFGRSRSRRAKLPKLAMEACWQSSLSTCSAAFTSALPKMTDYARDFGGRLAEGTQLHPPNLSRALLRLVRLIIYLDR